MRTTIFRILISPSGSAWARAVATDVFSTSIAVCNIIAAFAVRAPGAGIAHAQFRTNAYKFKLKEFDDCITLHNLSMLFAFFTLCNSTGKW